MSEPAPGTRDANGDPAHWSASRQAAAVRCGELSSSELLGHLLERVEKIDPALNAVVTLDVGRARALARAADDAAAHGQWWGPLHGLPITVKDALETAGLRSTGGAVELRDHVPARDAPAVSLLRQAGAVVFGKTNLSRWSEDIQTYNELFGTTNNPWDPGRTPGGSSGGSAAAVAAGLTSFELGTDIGGSLRIPAHFCGVHAHKPSFGIVSQCGYLGYPGSGVADADINVVGPIARSVDDLELLLAVLAGPDTEVGTGWRLELPPPRHDDIRRYRIGAWFDAPGAEVDPAVGALLRAAADRMSDAGAHVTADRPRLDLNEVYDTFLSLVTGAAAPRFDPHVADELSGSHARWLALNDRRAGMRRAWADWFADHDVLLCPVYPTTAFPHDQRGDFFDRAIDVAGSPRPQTQTLQWVGLPGVSYLPVTVVPVGRAPDGTPVGIQVIAPFLEDRTALFVARHLAAEVGVAPGHELDGGGR
ncbi:MAG: amidase [Pseudonocardia sp.]|nr:amidase [Pseudonocardia sp.]